MPLQFETKILTPEEQLSNLLQSIESLRNQVEQGLEPKIIIGVLNEFLGRKSVKGSV
jgi:hypothetical protein